MFVLETKCCIVRDIGRSQGIALLYHQSPSLIIPFGNTTGKDLEGFTSLTGVSLSGSRSLAHLGL